MTATWTELKENTSETEHLGNNSRMITMKNAEKSYVSLT